MIAALIYLAVTTGACVYFMRARGASEQERVIFSEFIAKINDLLPQTQCRECGYDGCLPYAAAIASDRAGLNLCPPGGAYTVRALARLTGKPVPAVIPPQPPNRLAFIKEDLCIGCVKCINACPVDAIVGAAKQMHGVIPQYCSGCGLCLDPCPVDCIVMSPARG